MKQILIIVVLVVTTLSFSSCTTSSEKATAPASTPATAASPSENVEQAVLRMEEELRVAITKSDTKTYSRLLGDDYVFTNQDAVLRTKAQMVSAYDSGSLKYESIKFDEIKVHPYGDTAVVTGRSTQTGKDNGKDIRGQFRYTRVYVKRQGSWQLVATQSTRIPEP
jgi:ketosteroid isomerase-like protein